MVALGSKMALRAGGGGGGGGGLGFKNEIYLKIFFSRSCLAQVLEIWYIALLGGPLLILFKSRSQGSRVQDGFAPEVLGSNHRNAQKYIEKFSSSEPPGLDI